MPGHTRLYRRGAVYYHRAAVPQDIASTYPKSEETFSLKTKDRAEALRLVRIEAVKVDERFEAHRKWLEAINAPYVDQLTTEQLSAIKQAYFHHLLDEDEDVRLEGFEDPEDAVKEFDPRPTFDEYNEGLETADSATRENLARGKQDTFFKSEAEEVLSWSGIEIKLSPSSSDWKKLIRILQEATVQATEHRKLRSQGEVVPTPTTPSRVTSAPLRGPKLSVLFEKWVLEKQRSESWSSKLFEDYHNWVGTFIEVTGDRELPDYVKADAREFKELLLRLPKNREKMPTTRGLSVLEAADRADASDMERLSPSTINKGLTRLGSFWNWLEANYDNATPNMFKGLKVDDPTKARDQRHPFSAEQLQAIFDGPIYRGCHSERRRLEPGDTLLSHTRWFWLPLLGLFSGARLNELCQLRLDDIQIEGSIRYLHLTNEGVGQKLKTGKKRKIPIHPTLIELGFLHYVEWRKGQSDGLLFDGIKPDKHGYHSSKLSENFSKYFALVGAKTEKTSFHSLRHNFEDACRRGCVGRDLMDALQGHSEGGMAARYGSGEYPLNELWEAIQKISYPKLNLNSVKGF